MNWPKVYEFLSMGGYGLYVWGSYGVTFGLLFAQATLASRRRRLALHQARVATEDLS